MKSPCYLYYFIKEFIFLASGLTSNISVQCYAQHHISTSTEGITGASNTSSSVYTPTGITKGIVKFIQHEIVQLNFVHALVILRFKSCTIIVIRVIFF